MLCWQGISGSIGVIGSRVGKTLKALHDRLLKDISLSFVDMVSIGQMRREIQSGGIGLTLVASASERLCDPAVARSEIMRFSMARPKKYTL